MNKFIELEIQYNYLLNVSKSHQMVADYFNPKMGGLLRGSFWGGGLRLPPV